MSKEVPGANREIDSVDDLVVGDALYSEASESPYWVTEITDTRVVLRDKSDSPQTWVRDTFENSLEAHTWIRQSSGRS